MIINIIKDITTVQKGIIAHGCNCLGLMGAGVARAIRFTWPKAYSEYAFRCGQYDKNTRKDLLGMVQISDVGDEPKTLFVANCFTQEECGSDGQVYASLEAIEEALNNVTAFAEHQHLPLYTSKIGCGLGGLDWETQVEPILKEIADNTDVTIYVCDLKK